MKEGFWSSKWFEWEAIGKVSYLGDGGSDWQLSDGQASGAGQGLSVFAPHHAHGGLETESGFALAACDGGKLPLVEPTRITRESCDARTCWPSCLPRSASGLGMRITLLILPKEPASAVISCSVASVGIPARHTRRSANDGESCEATATTFFFFLAGGGLADCRRGSRWGQCRVQLVNRRLNGSQLTLIFKPSLQFEVSLKGHPLLLWSWRCQPWPPWLQASSHSWAVWRGPVKAPLPPVWTRDLPSADVG